MATGKRWFRFSLRGMFVVLTLCAVLLGAQIRSILRRQHALSQVKVWVPAGTDPFADVPQWRVWVGAVLLDSVVFDSNATTAQAREFTEVFPNCRMYFVDPDEPYELTQGFTNPDALMAYIRTKEQSRARQKQSDGTTRAVDQ